MLTKKILLAFSVFSLILASCSKNTSQDVVQPPPVVIIPPSTSFPEKFETGTKVAYDAGDISLATGSWNLNDALIGTSTSDRKSGGASVRIQNNGTLTMNFNVTTGASVVSMSYASYGSDPTSSFELWASVNNGQNWTRTGNTVTVSSTTLTSVSFGMNYYGVVRFQVRKTGGGQLNIDNFNILSNSSIPTKDNNMNMGNPDNAVNNINSPDNYLLEKHQYALSYNNAKGTANWVSWHLNTAWKGAAARCNCFTPDYDLPAGFFAATTTDYTATGFDRGHLCPSEDRDFSDVDNAATFIMDNIMPQAPNLNQLPWSKLEDYCRTLMGNGSELYIIAGGYGYGGTGTLGGITNTIAGGRITVPSRYWKVIVILSVGSNDAMRVSQTTRVIAVDMPNTQTSSSQSWGTYRVSVNALQTILGYDLLSNVPAEVQAAIEASVDNGPTQ